MRRLIASLKRIGVVRRFAGLFGFEGRATSPAAVLPSLYRSGRRVRKLERDIWIVTATGLFDREKYLRENPDVAESGVDPIAHYVRYGGFEARNPCSHFDSRWYLATYPDVVTVGDNPLVHYRSEE